MPRIPIMQKEEDALAESLRSAMAISLHHCGTVRFELGAERWRTPLRILDANETARFLAQWDLPSTKKASP
jgi:hypothetical protein